MKSTILVGEQGVVPPIYLPIYLSIYVSISLSLSIYIYRERERGTGIGRNGPGRSSGPSRRGPAGFPRPAVRTYVRTCVRAYVRTCVCTYVRMYVCTYVRMYVCTYVCMYVRMYVRTYVCMYVCMCICVYTCVCIYIYIYIHTCVLATEPLRFVCLFTHGFCRHFSNLRFRNSHEHMFFAAAQSALYLKDVATLFVSSEIMRCKLSKRLSDHPVTFAPRDPRPCPEGPHWCLDPGVCT